MEEFKDYRDLFIWSCWWIVSYFIINITENVFLFKWLSPQLENIYKILFSLVIAFIIRFMIVMFAFILKLIKKWINTGLHKTH